MKKSYSLLAGAAILGASLMASAPAAMARDQVDWSVSVGSGGYGYPPPVMVQPPMVMHMPPPVVIQRPVPMVGYGNYYGGPPPRHWQHPGWRHHPHGHRHGYGHDRHDRDDRGHGHYERHGR